MSHSPCTWETPALDEACEAQPAWEASLGLPPPLMRSQTALSIHAPLSRLPPCSAVSWLASLPWKKPKAKIARNQRWQIPSSSVTNCTDVITPPAVPVCLCILLSPLETGTQECFLVQKNLEQSPVSARYLLCTYLCVSYTSVTVGLSVFVCVESTFCDRQMGMKYFKNVS